MVVLLLLTVVVPLGLFCDLTHPDGDGRVYNFEGAEQKVPS